MSRKSKSSGKRRQQPAAKRDRQAPSGGGSGRPVLLAVILIVVAGLLVWRQLSTVNPPLPDLEGVEPAVAAAVTSARAAVRRSPKSSDAWGNLGIVMLVHGFKPQADQSFREAETLAPDEPRWPYLRALTLVSENPGEALAPLQRAVELAPDDPAIRGKLAETLLSMGTVDDAEVQFQAMLDGSRGIARARFGLAQIAALRGEVSAAIQHLEPLVDDPHCRKKAHELMAQLYLRVQDEPAARDAAASAAGLPDDRLWPDPHSAEAFQQQADMLTSIERVEALRRRGETSKSQEMFAATEQRHPKLYWLVEGRAQLGDGDFAAAETALRKSIELAPNFIDAHFWLGKVLVAAEKFEPAVEAFQDALQLEPSYGPAHLELARCLRELNRDGVEQSLRKAVHYMPASAAAHRELGALLQQQARDKEAAPHLRAAAELAAPEE